jgi:hypothetical protein
MTVQEYFEEYEENCIARVFEFGKKGNFLDIVLDSNGKLFLEDRGGRATREIDPEYPLSKALVEWLEIVDTGYVNCAICAANGVVTWLSIAGATEVPWDATRDGLERRQVFCCSSCNLERSN